MRYLLILSLNISLCHISFSQSKWGFSIVIVSQNGDRRQNELHYYSETIDLSKLNCAVSKASDEMVPEFDVKFYEACLSKWFYEKTRVLNADVNEMAVTSFVKKMQGKIDRNCTGTQITCFYTKKRDVERIRNRYMKYAKRGRYKVVVVK